MRLFSYVVARDYGFAPNPFYGVCTLATCKPTIRRVASVGDWIIGTGSVSAGLAGRLVYAMRVSGVLSLDEYWADERFVSKRPMLAGSRKQAYGDNIYHRESDGVWLQANSHHSFHDGSPNPQNIDADTATNRMAYSEDFMYWGAEGPVIPDRFRDYEGVDVCALTQGHKSRFSDALVRDFSDWLATFEARGFLGCPGAWK